jgi:four helix bundle protein
MPTYQRFEDLPVWQEAIRLAERCEDFILEARSKITFSKRDQMDRASLSVSNNIAEGFERGSTADLINFLYIARGSAGEVRSMLCFFERRPRLKDFKSEISNLKLIAESCSRQLRAWVDKLQNSEIKGQRHSNEQSRSQWVKNQKNKVDRDKWEEIQRAAIAKLPKDTPLRRQWERKHGPLPDD